MHVNWSALAPLAAVAVSWVGIWWLRKRQLNFSLIALFALAVGVPIGLLAGSTSTAINPIGHIYINVLLASVAPLILVAIVSAITSLGSLAKLRSIGLRSIFWLMLSNALAVVLALGLALAFQPGQRPAPPRSARSRPTRSRARSRTSARWSSASSRPTSSRTSAPTTSSRSS